MMLKPAKIQVLYVAFRMSCVHYLSNWISGPLEKAPGESTGRASFLG